MSDPALGLLMLVWGADKFANPEHGMRVAEHFYFGLPLGRGVMALGIAFLPSGPRRAAAWWPMLMTGAVFGPLLAVDSALGLDQTSVGRTRTE